MIRVRQISQEGAHWQIPAAVDFVTRNREWLETHRPHTARQFATIGSAREFVEAAEERPDVDIYLALSKGRDPRVVALGFTAISLKIANPGDSGYIESALMDYTAAPDLSDADHITVTERLLAEAASRRLKRPEIFGPPSVLSVVPEGEAPRTKGPELCMDKIGPLVKGVRVAPLTPGYGLRAMRNDWLQVYRWPHETSAGG